MEPTPPVQTPSIQPSQPVQPMTPPAPPSNNNSLIIGGVLGLLVLSGALAFFIMNLKPSPPAKTQTEQTQQEEAPLVVTPAVTVPSPTPTEFDTTLTTEDTNDITELNTDLQGL